MVGAQRRPPFSYAVVGACHRPGSEYLVREPAPPGPPRPRLLDRVRGALRARHDSRRTEEAYVAWIRRYVLFHGKRHPRDMGAPEITRVLTALAVERRVARSADGPAAAAPSPRVCRAARRQGCGPARRARDARGTPHPPALVRHAPAGGRPRHPDGPGAARAPGREHDHDLHARPEPGAGWRAKPRRPDVQRMRGRGCGRPPAHPHRPIGLARRLSVRRRP